MPAHYFHWLCRLFHSYWDVCLSPAFFILSLSLAAVIIIAIHVWSQNTQSLIIACPRLPPHHCLPLLPHTACLLLPFPCLLSAFFASLPATTHCHTVVGSLAPSPCLFPLLLPLRRCLLGLPAAATHEGHKATQQGPVAWAATHVSSPSPRRWAGRLSSRRCCWPRSSFPACLPACPLSPPACHSCHRYHSPSATAWLSPLPLPSLAKARRITLPHTGQLRLPSLFPLAIHCLPPAASRQPAT